MSDVTIPKVLKALNIFTGAFIMTVCVFILFGNDGWYGYYYYRSIHWLTPFFIALFGGLLILSEFEIDWINTNCAFFKNNIGRGYYNLFIATTVLHYCDDYRDHTSFKNIICWICHIYMFATGIIYMVVGAMKVFNKIQIIFIKGKDSNVDNDAFLPN